MNKKYCQCLKAIKIHFPQTLMSAPAHTTVMPMRAVLISMADTIAHATRALLGQERIVLISMSAYKILATPMQHAQIQFLRMNVLAKQDFQAVDKTALILTNA